MSKESIIVVGGMLLIVAMLAVIRVSYDEIAAIFHKPTQEELAQVQAAIGELTKAAETIDTPGLIASVAPCEVGRKLSSACLTVSSNWEKAQNRQELARQIWKNWSEICTGKHLASKPADCFIHFKSPSGETLGGSGDEDGARIWIKR
jgi:hypothetical protein